MFEKKRVLRHAATQSIITGALMSLTVLVYILAGNWKFFALNLYGPFSRFVSGLVGFVFSFAPISVAELIIYGLIIGYIAYFAVAVAKTFNKKSRPALLRWLADLVAGAVWIVFIFTLFWGGNYVAPSLEERMGLDVRDRPEEYLVETARWLLVQLQDTAPQVPVNSDGVTDGGGFASLAAKMPACVEALRDKSPSIFGGGLVTKPKRVLASDMMSYAGIGGIYIPLTAECNVNANITDADLPSTMAHEMAHRLGCAPEEDANFVAYLACAESEYPEIRYSGIKHAFFYCLYRIEDADAYAELWAGIPGQIWEDINRAREEGERFEGEFQDAVTEFSSSVNDAYLQTFKQDGGIQSYGRVVDLLIAYYVKLHGEITY